MKLAEETDHLLLSGGVLFEARPRFLPDLLDRPFSIHQPDQKIGCWCEALESPCGVILENVPEFAAIVVAMNLRMAAEAWFQPRHPVP
jgi:hypothetical protein